MENKLIYLLLEIVAKNGNVKRLVHEGLSFRDIATLNNSLINKGLLIFIEEKIQLSEEGKKKHAELENIFKELDKDKWINKEEKSKIEKFGKDFIYLPSQLDLNI